MVHYLGIFQRGRGRGLVRGGGEVDDLLGSWKRQKCHPGRQNRKVNHLRSCPSFSETSEQHS